MLLIFAAALAAFVLVILFLSWYYKQMSKLIFGRVNTDLSAIVSEGAAPEKWEAKLNRRMAKCKNGKKKQKTIKWYIRYVNARMKDLIAYAERSPFLPDDDAKDDAVDALESFREEYLRRFEDMLEE